MKATRLKAIVSGDVIEIFQYEKPLHYEFETSGQHRDSPELDEDTADARKLDSRKRSMQRARSWITRLIHSNAWRWYQENREPFPPIFITFTFAMNITDVAVANKVFSKFIKRLNFNLYGNKKSRTKYLLVTEFQKRGAVHFHCLFFNLPIGLGETERETRLIAEIWGHGFIDAEGIHDLAKAIMYLTKYMLKGFDDTRLDGKKRYFGSRKLLRPVIIRQEHLVQRILSALPPERLVYENTFESEHQGKTAYSKFQLHVGEVLRLEKRETGGIIHDNQS